jgi:2-iminobutanoate/2-iminopropanoate deaminase
MKRKAFTAAGATSVGPYSHAVEVDGFVYLSAQTPANSITGEIIKGDIKAQTHQSFINLFNVLQSADLTSDNVIKVTVYLTDIGNFQAMNEIYTTQFNVPYPARTTIVVKELPLGSLIEMDMIAKR